MRVHCKQDFKSEIAAFSMFLEHRATNEDAAENSDNANNTNAELIMKFTKFLEMENAMKYFHTHGMHGHKHEHPWGKHGHHWGKYGKHSHHAMFGHHFNKHGHGFGRHGKHGHHGKRESKHFWYYWARQNEMTQVNSNEEDLEQGIEAGRNPSPPPQENSNNVQQNTCERCEFKRLRNRGRCGRWMAAPLKPQSIAARAKPVEPNTVTEEANNAASSNFVAMVENINIASSPRADAVNE